MSDRSVYGQSVGVRSRNREDTIGILKKGLPVLSFEKLHKVIDISSSDLARITNIDVAQLLGMYMSIPVTFEDDLCKHITPNQLPADWASHPIPSTTRDIGTAWAQSKASPVLAVPSAVVHIEMNFLLNPLHPEFTKMRRGSCPVNPV